jgi:hypothetical protein
MVMGNGLDILTGYPDRYPDGCPDVYSEFSIAIAP